MDQGRRGGDEQDLQQRGADHDAGRHAEQVDHRGDGDEAAADAQTDRQHTREEAESERCKRRDVKSGAIETPRSEEHTSELQSLMRISYAVICLKKKTIKQEPY